MVSSGGPLPDAGAATDSGDVLLVSRLVAVVYFLGCAAAAVPLVRGMMLARRLGREASPATDAAARAAFDAAGAELELRRPVRLLVHDGIAVPMTTGVLSPCVLLPSAALSWDPPQLRAALLHELAHVQAWDVAFAVAGRMAAVLLWFNPATWLVGRRLHAECELAADDRVLACGVKPSEYGSLLLVAGAHHPGTTEAACALAASGGLRRRLAAVLQPGRDLRPASRAATHATLGFALAASGAMGAVELAPTRDVLQGLMQEARWQSRAYAVVGLAPRPDSLTVARTAAIADPDPHVRAWATYALARRAPGRPDATPTNP
jgi:beta-lactamase regulating signal transducer with metallopeptidase domain